MPTSDSSTSSSDDQERTYYANQVRTVQVEQQVPLLFRAKDAKDESTRRRRILRERIDLGHRSALLFPLRRQVYGFAKGLREAGFEVETMRDLDFSTNQPKVLSYSSAKGLTFDSVLLPRLASKSFGRWTETNIRRLLFVAITRATDWVLPEYGSQSRGQGVEGGVPLGGSGRRDNPVGMDRPATLIGHYRQY